MKNFFIPLLSVLLIVLAGCRSRPDGVDYDQWKEALETRRATAARHVTAPVGFEVELLRTATKEEGSWVSLEFDDKGRLLIGREGPGILRMTLPKSGFGRPAVEVVNTELNECRGLLWAYDSLYANANNSKGFYRLRDTTGDDQFDEVTLLKKPVAQLVMDATRLRLAPTVSSILRTGTMCSCPRIFPRVLNRPTAIMHRINCCPATGIASFLTRGSKPRLGTSSAPTATATGGR